MRHGDSFKCYAENAGSLLADLNSSRQDGLAAWTIRYVERRPHGIVDVLASLVAGIHERSSSILHRLLNAMAHEDTNRVMLHGDFHPRQVLVDAGLISFIDFDEALSGPAGVDIGNFNSQLHMGAATGEITPEVAATTAQHFFGGYRKRLPGPSAKSVRIFTALGLMNVAHEPFRRHRQDWTGETMTLLDSVEHLLET